MANNELLTREEVDAYIEARSNEKATKKVFNIFGSLVIGGLAIIGAKTLYDSWNDYRQEKNQQ